jgi:hypothetical protein
VTGLTSVSGVSFVASAYEYPSSGLQDPTGHLYYGSAYFFGGNVVLASVVPRGDPSPVPDAGSSVLLFSAAMTGLAVFGRKKLLPT